jgi:biopolymer transport protein ExbB/TolQ
MTDVMRAFAEGGPWMWLILLCGLLHGIPVIAQFALIKKVDLTPYLWGGLGCILMIGLLATALGLHFALEAVSYTDPATRAALIAQGVAICLNVMALTVIVTIPGFFTTGIATVLVRKLTPVRSA